MDQLRQYADPQIVICIGKALLITEETIIKTGLSKNVTKKSVIKSICPNVK